MSEWREIEINEIVDIANTGLDAIKRAPIVDYDTGIKCMRIQDISQNKPFFDWGFTEVEKKNYEKFQLKKNDLIVARTGATVGVNKLVLSDLTSVFNNGLVRIRTKHEKCQPKFLYYHFCTDEFRGFIDSISGGTSSQPNIQINVLLSYDINLPPLEEQKAIAEVLSSLDDKIDLLHRQNKTLEQMAETLFRQWFVEEAGEDWEEGVLDDVLTVKGGSTPSTKSPDFWNGDIHWTTPKDLSTSSPLFLMDTLRKISDKGLEKISSGLLLKGTLLLSSRAPVGYLAFAEIPLAINQGYIAIIDDKGFSSIFIYLWLKTNMDYIKSHANGSTFQEISKTSFKALEIVIPPKDLRLKFDEIVNDNFNKIRTNSYQTRTLESLRDTLLPKLMSGEIRVVL